MVNTQLEKTTRKDARKGKHLRVIKSWLQTIVNVLALFKSSIIYRDAVQKIQAVHFKLRQAFDPTHQALQSLKFNVLSGGKLSATFFFWLEQASVRLDEWKIRRGVAVHRKPTSTSLSSHAYVTPKLTDRFLRIVCGLPVFAGKRFQIWNFERGPEMFDRSEAHQIVPFNGNPKELESLFSNARNTPKISALIRALESRKGSRLFSLKSGIIISRDFEVWSWESSKRRFRAPLRTLAKMKMNSIRRPVFYG